MPTLMDIYKKSNGTNKLFSEIIIVDWYDGCTQGVGKVEESSTWVICSLLYIDFAASYRIFSLTPVSEDWVIDFKMGLKERLKPNEANWDWIQKRIQVAKADYLGVGFLFKGRQLDEPCYQLIEVYSKDLPHLYDFDKVVNQTDQQKAKWVNYFT